MKRLFLLLILITLVSCKGNDNKTNTVTKEPISDNKELIEIYKNDQADRQTSNIDWDVVSVRDSEREKRVYELLDSNLARTSIDYQNAAMVFQHGADSVAYGMAVKMMRKAVELDPYANKWLLAASIDRNLLSRNKPQIYGTQYHKMGGDQPWELSYIDTTQVTDEERIAHRVETLAQLRERVKNMNRKNFTNELAEGKSMDQLIKYIKAEDLKDSNYDLSENELNMFGYQLMGEGYLKEALAVFKQNTELYPTAFNTYDSYGECLMAMGHKEKAIEAYKKSLELNPNNDNARDIINNTK